jgi:hypothetical protein
MWENKINNKAVQYFVLPTASVTDRHIRPAKNSHMFGAEDVCCQACVFQTLQL